jgi:t-SNARE complex subunit (syntaxin)
MNEELKACPFCGSCSAFTWLTGKGEIEVVRPGDARTSRIIQCANCGCRFESNEQGSWSQWNTRPIEDKLRTEIRVREGLYDVQEKMITELNQAIDSLTSDVKELNQMCRSALSIAERKGAETNWEPFERNLRTILDKTLHYFQADSIAREGEV